MAAPTQSPPERLLLSLLEPLRVEVDRVLEQMPDSRLEARRVITREWGLDPTPKELRAIVQVAHEAAGQGSLRDTVRSTLALRILVDRQLRPLFDGGQLQSTPLCGVTESMSLLLQAVDTLEHQLRVVLETAEPAEREFLLQVGSALIPSRDSLIAADILAPRLQLLATATSAEEIRSLAPSMNEEELALLSAASGRGAEGGTDASGSSSRSVCVAALMLRAVIEGDLAARDGALESDPEGVADEDSTERLERDRTAYHAVARRLQKQQKDAMLAGLTDYAESLRRIQGSLFSVYRKMTLALNADAPGTALQEPVEDEAVDLERLRAETAAHDTMADAERRNRPTESELYRDALQKAAAPAHPPVLVTDPYDLKRERLRIRILSSIAGVMLLVCASVYAARMQTFEDPLKVSLGELSDKLILSNATSVGPMMYAVVSHWSWDHLTDEKRLSSVRALGLSAQNEGYETVYLVDEQNEQLATWTINAGAKLVIVPSAQNRN